MLLGENGILTHTHLEDLSHCVLRPDHCYLVFFMTSVSKDRPLSWVLWEVRLMWYHILGER